MLSSWINCLCLNQPFYTRTWGFVLSICNSLTALLAVASWQFTLRWSIQKGQIVFDIDQWSCLHFSQQINGPGRTGIVTRSYLLILILCMRERERDVPPSHTQTFRHRPVDDGSGKPAISSKTIVQMQIKYHIFTDKFTFLISLCYLCITYPTNYATIQLIRAEFCTFTPPIH